VCSLAPGWANSSDIQGVFARAQQQSPRRCVLEMNSTSISVNRGVFARPSISVLEGVFLV
jgi:hypothetical protein